MHCSIDRLLLFQRQPDNSWFSPEPSHLPFGKSSGIALELPDHFNPIALSRQIRRHLTIAESFHRGRIPPIASVQQSPGFFDESVGQLPIDALLNAPIELTPVPIQSDHER